MSKGGALIDVEGADGSGKATQTKILVERLQKDGHTVTLFSFPRYYESIMGKLIGELLAGKHGDFMSAPPYLSALPYAIDRAGTRDAITDSLARGEIVVCDRYTPSSLAHQSAKLPKDEQAAFVDFLEQLEYAELGMPKPSLVIYLAVPTDLASTLVSKKEARGYITDGSARDHAERNIAHQDRTREAYLRLAQERGWSVIECAKEGAMRSKEDIHEELYTLVQKKLGL